MIFVSRMDLWPWICTVYIEETLEDMPMHCVCLKGALEDAQEGPDIHMSMSVQTM